MKTLEMVAKQNIVEKLAMYTRMSKRVVRNVKYENLTNEYADAKRKEYESGFIGYIQAHREIGLIDNDEFHNYEIKLFLMTDEVFGNRY